MNDTSYTDEQLLNLINSTITDETEHEISSFTGGSVQVTSTYGNKITNYKIHLFFGYNKSKNPITYTEDIDIEEYFIWTKAILLKVQSMQLKKVGSTIDKLNRRMNTSNQTKKEKKVEVIGNKVVGRGKVEPLRSRNESSTKVYEKDKDFSLKVDTHIDNVSDEYIKALEKYLTHYINDTGTKRMTANSPLGEPMAYQEFIDQLTSKASYKYKNFVTVYKTWLRNDSKRTLARLPA